MNHEFPGHIACDSASNSELVVPIIKNDILYGVLELTARIQKVLTILGSISRISLKTASVC